MSPIYCPASKCHGSVDALVCIYRCRVGTKIKCAAYASNYEQIRDLEIEEKYLEKYGEAVRPLPLSMRKRRKKRGNQEG